MAILESICLIQLKTLYPVLSSVTILSLPQQIRLLLMGTTSKIESINRMITISYKQYKNYKVVNDYNLVNNEQQPS